MASIADVAKKAGVSTGTVCNVANNRRVNSQTREVVLRVMDELGYEPASQRRVRSGLSRKADLKSVTLVTLGQSVRSVLRAPVYFELIHGIERACDQEGLPFRLRALPAMEDRSKLSVQKGEGLLLFGDDSEGLDYSLLKQVPTVRLFGTSFVDTGLDDFDRVSYDNGAVGRLAADWLWRKGCRNVAVICPENNTRRIEAVRYLTDKGCSVQALDVGAWPGPQDTKSSGEQGTDNDDWLRNDLKRLLESKDPITGLFLHSDVLTAHAYPILHQMGVDLTTDLAVISCNNDEAYLMGLSPRPTTIDIHVDAVGRAAVGVLLERAMQPNEPVKSVILKPSLIDNRTA